MLKACLFVGMGGFLGSVFRYLLGLIPIPYDFPVITMLINIAGSVLIGFIMGLSTGMDKDLLLFLKTGICGGFTTFSTFSLDIVTLMNEHKWVTAYSYVFGSVLLGLLGVFLGMAAAKRLC